MNLTEIDSQSTAFYLRRKWIAVSLRGDSKL